jgi:hypothetical protein
MKHLIFRIFMNITLWLSIRNYRKAMNAESKGKHHKALIYLATGEKYQEIGLACLPEGMRNQLTVYKMLLNIIK